jgi:tryptophan halogenase
VNRKNIVIVGGGLAGWLVAIHLLDKNVSDFFIKEPSELLSVTLIESETIAPIGVGEGTTPPFRILTEKLNINIDEIGGTYKSGIQYIDWYINYSSKYNKNYHPFFDVDENEYNEFIENYSYEYALKESDRYSKSDENNTYHFEVEKFIKILKNKCLDLGLNYIQGTVNDIEINNKGNITSVLVGKNTKFTGDLFVDCTGFKRVLISKLNPNIIDFSDSLICDRAIVTHLLEENTKNNYWTGATALSNGWSWRIPLRNKTGTGYVYSSKFISDEDAKKEFNEYLGTNQDFRVIKWKSQAIEKPFINNCIAIGLSSNFFEPMEATNIAYAILQSDLLVEYLVKEPPKVNRTIYNKLCKYMYEDFYSYIFFHYKLSKREDSKFWKYVSNIKIPKVIKQHLLNCYENFFTIDDIKGTIDINYEKNNTQCPECYPKQSWLYLFAGFNKQLKGKING